MRPATTISSLSNPQHASRFASALWISTIALFLSLISGCQNKVAMQTPELDRARIAQTIYHKSGLAQSVAQIPEHMTEQINNSGVDMPESITRAMLESFAAAFNKASGESVCQAHFENALTDETLLALDAWFSSETGEQISQAELAMMQLSDEAEVAAAIEQASTAAPERIQQVTSLLFDTGLADMMKQIMTNVAVATGTAVFKALSPEEMQTQEQLAYLKKMLQTQANIQASAMNGMLMSLYTWGYRDIPADDMTQYIDLLSSETGQRYIEGTTVCVDTLFANFNTLFSDKLKAQSVADQSMNI